MGTSPEAITLETKVDSPQKTKTRTGINVQTFLPHTYRCTPVHTTGVLAHPRFSHITDKSQEREPVWMSRDRWVDREKVGHMHKGTVFSCKERWNCNSFRKLDETTGHPVKWNKPDSQVNIACFLFHAESRFKYRSVCMCIGVYICICVWGRGESTPPQCYLNSQALWLSHHGFSVTPLLISSLLHTLALYVVIHSAAPRAPPTTCWPGTLLIPHLE